MSLPRQTAALCGLGLVVCLTGHALVGSVPAVGTNQWAAGPALNHARAGATATSMGAGNVLVTGGRGAAGPLASAEWLTSSGIAVPVAPMSVARAEHTAALVGDGGNVLVAGGMTVVATEQGTAEVVTGSVEVFDAAAATWYSVGALSRPRAGATAVALPEGRVAIVGGHDASGPVLEIEIYDPAAGGFVPGGATSQPREGAAVTSTRDGHIVVVGGSVDGAPQATADIIDPVGGTVATVMLTSPRTGASATTTVEDQVLIAGGSDGSSTLATTEVLDPVTGNSSSGATLGAARADHRAYLLPHNGGVLLVGGSNAGGLVTASELVIPWVNAAQATPLVADPRSKTAGAAGPQDGVFVVTGGSSAAGAPSATSDYFGFATVKTDKGDYAPGEFVTITGTGWQPGETVNLTLHEVGTGASDTPLNAVVEADGTFVNDFWAPNDSHLGVRFYLTATGAGASAQTTFTDNINIQNATVTIRDSGCSANQATFTLGETVCARVVITSTSGSGAGDQFFIQWVNPSSAVVTPPSTIETSPATVPTTFDRTFATTGSTPTGSWTVRVCKTVACGGGNNVAQATFTLGAAATITGTVYNDANGNGSFDSGETGISGVTVTRDGTGTTSTTTNGSGLYTFSSLAAGTYSINYTVPVGFANTGTRPLSVTVAAGASSTGNNFFAAPQHTLTFAQSGISNDTAGATIVTVNGTGYSFADLPKQLTFTAGATVTYSYSTPVTSTVAGKRYALTTPPPTPASPITVSGAATVTGTYKTQYQVTFAQSGIGVDSTGTVVTVDGNAKTAANLPFLTDWLDSGASLSYSYSTPVASTVTGKRYVLTSPAPTPATPISVTSPFTVTGTYAVEYLLTFAKSGLGADATGTVVTINGTVLKTAGDLPFSDWFTSGASVTYAFSDPVASSVSGKRYALTTPAPTPASPVTVSGPATVTGTYKVQFQLTFAQSGIGGDSTGTVVTINGGTTKTASQLPFDGWFDSGSSVVYAFSDPVASTVSGKRYALTAPAPTPATPVTVSGTATITGTYKTQFQVTFAQSGIGGDSTGTVVTVGVDTKTAAHLPFTTDWLDSGANLSYSYSSPVASTVTGKRYVLTTPAPTPASPFSVTSPLTVTGTYAVEYLLTFAQSGLGGDTTGTVVTINGTLLKTAGDLPFSEWFASGAPVTYAFSDPVASTVSGKRYALTTPAPAPASPVTVSGPATVTGTYKVQFQLSFTQSGIGGDTTGTVVTINGGTTKTAAQLPFDGWFDNGSAVTYAFSDPVASSVSGKRYALTTPTPTPASPVTVSGAATITGTYKTQFQVTFAQSGIGGDSTGTVVTVGVDAKTAGNLPFTTDWLDSGANLSYSYSSPVASTVTGKRYVLTTPAPTPTSPFSVTSPLTVTGTYAVEYLLTFAQSGLAGDATGTVVTINGTVLKTAGDLPFSDWFASGASVTYAFTSPVGSSVSGKRYVLTTPAPTPGSPVTLSGPATITGTYKTQFQLSFAQSGIGGDSTGTVVTINGITPRTAAQLPYDDWFDNGSAVTYAFSDPVASTVSGKRYTLTTPAASPASPVTVSGAATITGTYKTQFQVTFAQSGIGGDSTGTVVTVGVDAKTAGNLPFTTDWLDSGANLSYSYSSPVASTVTGKRYVLTTPAPTPASPFSVTSPLTVTGTYAVEYLLTFAKSGLGGDATGTVVTINGTVLKTAGDLPFSDWFVSGAPVTYAFSDPVASSVAGKRYALTTPPPTPASPVTVSAPATITGTYKVQFQLTFAQSGIGVDSTGTVVMINGGVAKSAAQLAFGEWFDAGSSVTYLFSDPVASTVSGKRYALTAPAPMPASPVTVSGPATITGTYKTQFQVTFSQTGISAGSTGSNPIVKVQGVDKTLATPFADWFDENSSVTYSFYSPISTVPVSAQQYELTNGGSLPASPINVTAALTVNGIYTLNIYTIQYLRPIDQSIASSYILNTGKNGRVIPVKVDVFKNGTRLNAGTFLMKVGGSNCAAGAPTDLVTEYADAGNSNGNTNLFRWADGFLIYNLDTGALGLATNSCYRLDVYLNATSGPTAVLVSSATWAIFKPIK